MSWKVYWDEYGYKYEKENIMQRILNFLEGKKTILGFIAVGIYSALIQFFGVPSEAVVWGLIGTWTGVSGVIHSNKL